MAREPTRSANRSQDVERLARGLTAVQAALGEARWFAGKDRPVAGFELVDAVELPCADGGLLLIAAARYADGGEERYTVPGRLVGGDLVPAGPEDAVWPSLARLVAEGGWLDGLDGRFVAEPAVGAATAGAGRLLTEDQSNTSVVLGEQLIVKLYRRLQPGEHPEPELLAGLARVGGAPAPVWRGTLRYAGSGGNEAVAVLYDYVPGEPVGWEPVIVEVVDAVESEDGRALAALAETAGALGGATADLHRSLREAFGTAPADAGRAVADLEDAEALLERAIATGVAPVLSEAAGRAEAARRLAGFELLEGASLQRVHGDLHVAQFVASPDGPVVVDFEGTPGWPLEARRRHDSPLRDLAGLLLSLDHVAAAAARRHGFGRALTAAFGWAADARKRALAAYESAAGEAVDRELLAALEVERECREAIYAATVLPEWSYAPRLTLERLLAPGAA